MLHGVYFVIFIDIAAVFVDYAHVVLYLVLVLLVVEDEVGHVHFLGIAQATLTLLRRTGLKLAHLVTIRPTATAAQLNRPPALNLLRLQKFLIVSFIRLAAMLLTACSSQFICF